MLSCGVKCLENHFFAVPLSLTLIAICFDMSYKVKFGDGKTRRVANISRYDTSIWCESLNLVETSAPKAIKKAAPSISGLCVDCKTILFDCLWGVFELIVMSL